MGQEKIRQIKRVGDWSIRLQCYIESVHEKPFRYGKQDCCTFALGAIKAITGVDVKRKMKIRYRDKEAARKIRAMLSIQSAQTEGNAMTRAVGYVARVCGFVEITPLEAQRGDLVLFRGILGDTAGICIGIKVIAPGANGLLADSISVVKRAWRIG